MDLLALAEASIPSLSAPAAADTAAVRSTRSTPKRVFYTRWEHGKRIRTSVEGATPMRPTERSKAMHAGKMAKRYLAVKDGLATHVADVSSACYLAAGVKKTFIKKRKKSKGVNPKTIVGELLKPPN